MIFIWLSWLKAQNDWTESGTFHSSHRLFNMQHVCTAISIHAINFNFNYHVVWIFFHYVSASSLWLLNRLTECDVKESRKRKSSLRKFFHFHHQHCHHKRHDEHNSLLKGKSLRRWWRVRYINIYINTFMHCFASLLTSWADRNH